MKRFYSFFIIMMILASLPGFAQPTTTDFNKLSWLEGSWVRTNAKPGHSGSEHWQKVSATEWQGRGITMKGTDTAFVEKLKLIVKDNAIYYVADVPGNKEPVLFRFTQLSENGFACENPMHDFPKKIEYHRTGNSLKATISAGGKSIDYQFEKKQ